MHYEDDTKQSAMVLTGKMEWKQPYAKKTCQENNYMFVALSSRYLGYDR